MNFLIPLEVPLLVPAGGAAPPRSNPQGSDPGLVSSHVFVLNPFLEKTHPSPRPAWLAGDPKAIQPPRWSNGGAGGAECLQNHSQEAAYGSVFPQITEILFAFCFLGVLASFFPVVEFYLLSWHYSGWAAVGHMEECAGVRVLPKFLRIL